MYACVHVCVCVCVCVCVREREIRRTVMLKICTLTERTDGKCELSSCLLCFRSVLVRKKAYISYNTEYCNSLRKYAMKFSTEVSEAHAAARVKGSESADGDSKACIHAFQQLLSSSPWTQRVPFSLCSASRVVTF